MKSATQLTGELVPYEQPVSGDTIVSATWSVDDNDGTISSDTFTSSVARMYFQADKPGRYLVTVLLELASGQNRKGQIRIDVVQALV
jgi:hypothetical protein